MLGENVKDHGGAVDDFYFGGVFQGTTLAWRQVIVHNDGVGFLLRHDSGEFAGFAGANVCSCVRLDTMLQQAVAYHGTGGFGERGKFSQ